jgi:hypothetical protein
MMLAEEEVRERTQYCYCVLLQLGWLHDNDSIEPRRYLQCLQNSSLQLAGDEFVTATIEEALLLQQPDGGLGKILALYEGIVHAFCEVLEEDMETLNKHIPVAFLRQLAAEMEVEITL